MKLEMNEDAAFAVLCIGVCVMFGAVFVTKNLDTETPEATAAITTLNIRDLTTGVTTLTNNIGIRWIGHPVVHEVVHDKAWLPDVELGLASNGLVVWRVVTNTVQAEKP